MKYCLLYLVFSLSIIQVYLYLPFQKRKELLDKLAIKISPSDFDLKVFDQDDYFKDSFKQMKYNVSDIQALIAQYNLPESYNYLTDVDATSDVKNQASCGSCWSFAATSALAYRYKKLGLDISLSPQDALSCYLPDCDRGNNNIDPQLNLVKNGTVTEGCFPYASADGKTIPQCPNQCEDGSEFKKYYAQNAYKASNYDQSNFYDLVILIMDQLVTQGPILGGFTVYSDFYDFYKDKTYCKNNIYTYDGVSDNEGGHAVTIVGYGLLNNKFYWLIQNSWGADWCDNGFFKMEFGQFSGISFSEPYIDSSQADPVEIDVTLKSAELDCSLTVATSSLNDWTNTLNAKFVHETEPDFIEFQIGKNTIKGQNEINCNYEINRLYYNIKKGKYFYKEAESLGKENTFKLNSFEGSYFSYYGIDTITPLTYRQYFVSQEGSKILFTHSYQANDETMPSIYKNLYYNYPMNNCHHLKTSTPLSVELAYCEITKEDLDYIGSKSSVDVYNQILCGYFQSTDIILIKLDTNNYPVFTITQFFKPNGDVLTKNSELVIASKIEGNVQYFLIEQNYFYVIMDIENNGKNETVLANCAALANNEDIKVNLTCKLSINDGVSYQYKNIYLLPYFAFSNVKRPFDVIISKTMKAGEGDEPDPIPTDPTPTDPTPTDIRPTGASYLGYSISLFIGLTLLLF